MKYSKNQKYSVYQIPKQQNVHCAYTFLNQQLALCLRSKQSDTTKILIFHAQNKITTLLNSILIGKSSEALSLIKNQTNIISIYDHSSNQSSQLQLPDFNLLTSIYQNTFLGYKMQQHKLYICQDSKIYKLKNINKKIMKINAQSNSKIFLYGPSNKKNKQYFQQDYYLNWDKYDIEYESIVYALNNEQRAYYQNLAIINNNLLLVGYYDHLENSDNLSLYDVRSLPKMNLQIQSSKYVDYQTYCFLGSLINNNQILLCKKNNSFTELYLKDIRMPQSQINIQNIQLNRVFSLWIASQNYIYINQRKTLKPNYYKQQNQILLVKINN